MNDEENATPHVSLVQQAKRSVALSFENFDAPEDDMIPEMMWRGHSGLGIMALACYFDNQEEKQSIAEMMMCHLAIEQATEATFAHTIWAIDNSCMDAWVGEGRPKPAQFSGRHEEIFLLHVTPDGEALHRARITRYPDKPPTLAEWQMMDSTGRVVGLFRNAVYNGVTMGRRMPDELAQKLRGDMEKHGPEPVLAAMVKSYRLMAEEARAEQA